MIQKTIIIIIFITIINFILPSALADESCPDNFYYPDSDLNACIYKHGGYLDSDGCVYAFDQVDDSLCVAGEETPAPPETTPSDCGTAPENAVCNLNQATLPQEIIKTVKPENKTIFQQIAEFFASILGFRPNHPEELAPRSKVQHQVQTPPEVQPDPKLNLIEQTGENLGKQTGIFSVNLPDEIKKNLKTTINFGEAFERAHFPEGINPISR